jgi:hypothetical protein
MSLSQTNLPAALNTSNLFRFPEVLGISQAGTPAFLAAQINSGSNTSAAPNTRNNSLAALNTGQQPLITLNRPSGSREAYERHLLVYHGPTSSVLDLATRDTYKRKEPLQAECDKFSVHWAKKDSLARLRGLLIDHW